MRWEVQKWQQVSTTISGNWNLAKSVIIVWTNDFFWQQIIHDGIWTHACCHFWMKVLKNVPESLVCHFLPVCHKHISKFPPMKTLRLKLSSERHLRAISSVTFHLTSHSVAVWSQFEGHRSPSHHICVCSCAATIETGTPTFWTLGPSKGRSPNFWTIVHNKL